jgi:hypothetical protein
MVRHGDERLVVDEARANGEAREPIYLKEPDDTGTNKVQPLLLYTVGRNRQPPPPPHKTRGNGAQQ